MKNDRSKTLELVIKASAGDINAFEDLYRLKLHSILCHINSMINSPNEAEDIAQEVGISMFRKLATLKAPEAFQVWMQRIITNECYDYLRKKKRTVEHVNIDDYTDFAREENKEMLPGEFSEMEDARRIIFEVIEKLPPQRKRIVIMYYYDDMPTKDIASALEISLSTVLTSIMKAKKMIKKELEKNENTLPDIANSLSSAALIGSLIDRNNFSLWPPDKLDSIAKAVSTAVTSGAGAAAALAATTGAGAGTTAVVHNVIVAVVAVLIIATAGIYSHTHNNPADKDIVFPSAETVTAPENAATADLSIAYLGGECECGHLNPKDAEIGGSFQDGTETVWRITKAKGGAEVASAAGTDVSEALITLIDSKEDGEYKLVYTNTAKNGGQITLIREFVIDTGDKSHKLYQ
jgi:RNA polymerase sigma-70 factor (ECF subfamily)